MSTLTHLNDGTSPSGPVDPEQLIEAELINLFFKQTPFGIAAALINAGALVFLLWSQVDYRLLIAWFTSLVLISGVRVVATLQYRKHRRRQPDPVLRPALTWVRWNITGLAIMGLLWSATMLVIFPAGSLVHQLCTAFILCGIVSTSTSLYAGVPMVYKVFGLVPLVALIGRFLTYADPIHFVLAVLASFYLVLLVLTATHLTRTRRRLLSTQIELAHRVNQRTKALEEANNALKTEIQDNKLAEAAHRRISEQLEEARKTEAIATLAGGIAHQFNNALAVISGNIELLELDYRHDAQIGNYSQPISKAADRMTQLTSQLLAYAKGGKYKERPNDLGTVAETTLALIKHTIAPEISVNKILEPNLPKVKIDVTQIQMVISAIVANAAEAINGSGSISIACSRVTIPNAGCVPCGSVPAGDYVILSVSDTGVGMDEKTVKRIFEPFFTTKFQGRGLGMAAVYGIIKNHGGYIHVTSQTGQGTRVYVYFPALADAGAEPEISAGQDVQGSGTVFMIEDDPGVVDVNQTWLQRIGYEVLVATTAEQATQIICRSDTPIDVVLLDLVLPDMGGASLYPLIRQHRPSARVIVCSGYGLNGTTQELLDAGADAFIQKPYTLAGISDIITKVMQSKSLEMSNSKIQMTN